MQAVLVVDKAVMAVAFSLAAISVFSIIPLGSYARIDFSKAPFPPRFVHEQNDPVVYFILENDSTQPSDTSAIDLKIPTLRCKAEAIPAPQYKWYKNGTLLDLEAFDERIKRHEGEGTISFTKVSKEDEGDYVCKASNDNGTAVSETVSLQLAYILFFPNSLKITTIAVEEGEPFSFNCTAPNSNPKSKVGWTLMVLVSG
ncbi:unnamed protein product [Enterobius vermicularis]|uniref:Ig-like domain-containing protein n=1 Tax=Enterobius vermicularis TaxID=51028 RepID=A0A0N4VKY1_ENTVE|nr:unnamed protein product [Enterobius vermicularis]